MKWINFQINLMVPWQPHSQTVKKNISEILQIIKRGLGEKYLEYSKKNLIALDNKISGVLQIFFTNSIHYYLEYSRYRKLDIRCKKQSCPKMGTEKKWNDIFSLAGQNKCNLWFNNICESNLKKSNPRRIGLAFLPIICSA